MLAEKGTCERRFGSDGVREEEDDEKEDKREDEDE